VNLHKDSGKLECGPAALAPRPGWMHANKEREQDCQELKRRVSRLEKVLQNKP